MGNTSSISSSYTPCHYFLSRAALSSTAACAYACATAGAALRVNVGRRCASVPAAGAYPPAPASLPAAFDMAGECTVPEQVALAAATAASARKAADIGTDQSPPEQNDTAMWPVVTGATLAGIVRRFREGGGGCWGSFFSEEISSSSRLVSPLPPRRAYSNASVAAAAASAAPASVRTAFLSGVD